VAQAVSLGCYALLYRRVLASLGARVPFWLTARVTLASFLVSHVTPFGSAAGTVLNVSTLETEGVATSTTGEAIGLTRLVSTLALIALLGTGLVATAGRHLAHTYLVIAGAALALVVSVLAIHGKAGQAADHAHAQWQSFKADTSAKMQGLRGRIERQRDERDVKAAERRRGRRGQRAGLRGLGHRPGRGGGARCRRCPRLGRRAGGSVAAQLSTPGGLAPRRRGKSPRGLDGPDPPCLTSKARRASLAALAPLLTAGRSGMTGHLTGVGCR